MAERPGPLVAAALVGLALAVVGTGAVQVATAMQEADQRAELVRVVEQACDQDRVPADVCAAGRVADE